MCALLRPVRGRLRRGTQKHESQHRESFTDHALQSCLEANVALLLGELKAGDGARDHVLLNLHEVAVGKGHAENGEQARAVGHEYRHARPIMLIDAAAEANLGRGRARNV